MAWMIPVNEMLHEDITKLNYTLIPPGFQGSVRNVRVMQDSLSKLIDQLGEQSAAAQGLSKVITTAEKLRNAPTHTLYLLKDAQAKGGQGEVIGMLKVGRKRLFLFDERDHVREVEPLCVLDFFVVQNRRRHGHGRTLFDYMLRDMDAKAHLLAIDGPSPKMEQFMINSYGVGRLIRQNNNFAVCPQFFENSADEISKSGSVTPAISTAVGRFTAPKPHSAIATVIHGGGNNAYQYETNGEEEERAIFVGGGETERQVEVKAVPSPAVAEVSCAPERPRTLQVSPPSPTPAPSPAPISPAATSPAARSLSRRDSQLTDKGFFDVKFYHNKLCKSGSVTPDISPAVGRFTAPKPHSAIATVIHGGGNNDQYETNGEEEERAIFVGGGETERQVEVKAVPSPAVAEVSCAPERPRTLQVSPPSPTPAPSPAPISPAATSPAARSLSRRDSQLTDKGFFDVKFYHNKLW